MTTNINIKQTKNYKRATIMALSGSWFSISNAYFEKNVAEYDSVILYASNIKEMYHTLEDSSSSDSTTTIVSQISEMISCTITKNEVVSGGKAISLIDGNLQITDSFFGQNYIYTDTEGIFATQGTLLITNTVFKNNYRDSWYTQLSNALIGDINGAFLSIGRNVSFYGKDLTLYGGRAQYGGCVSIQGSSEAYFENSTFTSCAATVGGAIFGVNFNSLVVTGCSFQSNVVFKGYGQNILASNVKKNLTLINSNFTSYHNSIFFRDGLYLYGENLNFDSEPLRVSQIPY